MTLCLDTQCLVWAIKRQGDRVQEATSFVAQAANNGCVLVAPTVCIHEMLIRASEEQRAACLTILGREFLVAAFNLGCAETAARIEAAYGRPPSANRYKDRVDIQVVATAIQFRADAVVSYDPDVRRIAGDRILVRGFEEPGTLHTAG